MSLKLDFVGGPTVIKTRPTREQLQDSALAWLRLAQNQMGSCQYWAEQGDRTHETLQSLKVLASHIEHARRALAESEHAK